MSTIRMSCPAPVPVPKTARLLAVAALLAAVALLRLLPLRAVLAVAHAARLVMRRHPDAAAVRRLAAARDWAGRRWPGRAACLENSLAVYLTAASCGYYAAWCIGCRFAPAAAHAWTRTRLGPLGEPTDPDRPLHITVTVGELNLTRASELS
ncbi:lasso peptide biosynthesis B2 protein [Planomonospora parontospora]|uniref:lasso peptide biosynthesis B2 protein n=1 Tax=Planomonospora parontospora TaxID=58119 RepID=UPI00166FB26B|nr:lasso peptide biosynthesis B2 protein [Planomonospora parontospora]GGL53565.1 hypothetical protein GCM10014719_63570 [Planomonospora parontospora subsp. antibiotica]GII19602.1 hypothetical protein Ppa05_63280 [Planomonospora parontospora subsp. antibiotica]